MTLKILGWYSLIFIAYNLMHLIKRTVTEDCLEERMAHFVATLMYVPTLLFIVKKLFEL